MTFIPHSAVSIIENKTKNPPNPTKTKSNNHNTLDFHWKYDPSRMSTDTIQKIFNQALKNHGNLKKFQITI